MTQLYCNRQFLKPDFQAFWWMFSLPRLLWGKTYNFLFCFIKLFSSFFYTNILFSKVSHQVVECFWVDVFTNLHQDEPISEPDLLHDEEHILSLWRSGAALENIGTNGTENSCSLIFLGKFYFFFYLEAIVMILKQKKVAVQQSTRRDQNQRKK